MPNEQDMSVVYTIATWVISTVSLGTLVYLFIINRILFYIFASVVFVCSIVLIFEFTLRRLTRHSYRDINQYGTYAKPLARKGFTISPVLIPEISKEKTPAKANPTIPTLAEMLAKDMFDGINMVFGYQISEVKDLVPVTGMFNDIRTFAILGKGGVGKTIRLFFLLIQCILSHGTIYLCDPHLMKLGSITRLLVPLSKWVKFAVPIEYLNNEYRKANPLTEEVLNNYLMNMIAEFKNRMEKRVHGLEDDLSPCVLVIDEFSRLMYNEQYGEEAVNVVVSCANQYRDLQGYSVVVMHELVATNNQKIKNLVARLRKSLHAVFIMRTDKAYAGFFVDNKVAKKAERLKTGETIFLNTDGDIKESVFTPKSTVTDAFTVAKLMLSLQTPDEYPQLYEHIAIHQYPSKPLPKEIAAFSSETNGFSQAENNNFTSPTKNLSLPPPSETNTFNTREERKQEIIRLRKLGFTKQSEVILHIWKVKAGASEAYKNALAEYKQLLGEIVAGV